MTHVEGQFSGGPIPFSWAGHSRPRGFVSEQLCVSDWSEASELEVLLQPCSSQKQHVGRKTNQVQNST